MLEQYMSIKNYQKVKSSFDIMDQNNPLLQKPEQNDKIDTFL